jgi:uncharacterized protein
MRAMQDTTPTHTPDRRPLVIYHANCADGFSAAWCFWHRYGSAVDFHPGRYGDTPPDVTGRSVYLVDFSYKRAVVLAMLETAAHVVLIDHHKTAIDDLAGIDSDRFSALVDLNRSGATLAWDFLFPHVPRPLLLGHVEDRDLWRFRLPGTREIQAFVFSHDYTFEQWDVLMAADQVQLLQMTAAGAAIERKHHKDVAELVAVCKRRMVIGACDVPVASLPYTLSSDAGALMAKGELFAACYWDTDKGRQFSLRSLPGGMDVSLVAEQYGGGGHQHAAGFRVPRGHVLAVA